MLNSIHTLSATPPGRMVFTITPVLLPPTMPKPRPEPSLCNSTVSICRRLSPSPAWNMQRSVLLSTTKIIIKFISKLNTLCAPKKVSNNFCDQGSCLVCDMINLLTGTVTDVRETVLTSEGVRVNIELAPEVVRDKFPERGIPPLATISSTSPLVCCKTPIAC